MTDYKLKIQRFRTNDLVDNGGKQFEMGKGWCEDFFGISPDVSEITLFLTFKPLIVAHKNLDETKIELRLSDVNTRGDRKAYANAENAGCSQIKDFFINKLHLNPDDNISDYFAFYKINQYNYILFYVPELLYNNFIQLFKTEIPPINVEDINVKKTKIVAPLQQIYYGAPGTGKSFTINDITKIYSAIRTTFHPDSDYSTFVGAYKPTMKTVDLRDLSGHVVDGVKEERITYTFVKQAFLKAYLAAWKKYAEGGDSAEPQFLIIEEINRGNCAQIFGDLFQLLDRSDNGFSTYPIEADADLQKEIEKAFSKEEDYIINGNLSVDGAVKDYTSNYGASLSEDIKNGRVLLLPNNLYIWATMNTSDQSLFPIDSAFKRRWDWKYVRITNGYEREEDGKRKLDDNGKPIPLEWKIDVDGEQYDWWQFVQAINIEIADKTDSDDKKLGYFFCKAKDKKIDAETFVGKVIFYLWNDVFKDENADIFNLEGVGKVTFDQFYTEDEHTGETKVNETMTGAFIKKVLEAHKIPDMNTNEQE